MIDDEYLFGQEYLLAVNYRVYIIFKNYNKDDQRLPSWAIAVIVMHVSL